MAGRQFGRIRRDQLKRLGIADVTIARWITQGYLIRVLPGVYAVGYVARTVEADLAAAVLYAGPGAMLSHATAAWWVGLIDSKPYMVDVTTRRRCDSLPGIRVHQRRLIERVWHNRLPVTPLAETLIDFGAKAPLAKLRLALARADYHRGLDPRAVEARLGRGRPGSARLRAALKRHQPSLARTHSGLEVVLFELCERGRLPLPELNAEIAGWEVDALWRQEGVAVEIDGPTNHRSPAQIRRDRRKEHALRAVGLIVLRYSDDQVEHHGAALIAELGHALTPPAQSA